MNALGEGEMLLIDCSEGRASFPSKNFSFDVARGIENAQRETNGEKVKFGSYNHMSHHEREVIRRRVRIDLRGKDTKESVQTVEGKENLHKQR